MYSLFPKAPVPESCTSADLHDSVFPAIGVCPLPHETVLSEHMRVGVHARRTAHHTACASQATACPATTADRRPPTADHRRRRRRDFSSSSCCHSTTQRTQRQHHLSTRARAYDNHAAAQPHSRASRSARCTAAQTTSRPAVDEHFVGTLRRDGTLSRWSHTMRRLRATGMTTIMRQTCAIGTLHSSTAAGTSSPRKRPPCDTKQTPPFRQ